jgi:4a-hydroxytetrahydrobiopterin dehydratase
VVEHHHLEANFVFADFATALAAANMLGAIAEEQWHHPDLQVAWGKLGVTLWTHKIDGLSEADFVLAAKFDRALRSG